jgi:hypothetical protein
LQDWEAFLEQYNGNDAQIIEEDESAADSGTVSGVYRFLHPSDFLSGCQDVRQPHRTALLGT